MRNYSKVYKVSILIFLMLISLNSTAFAQRLLFGLSMEGVDFFTHPDGDGIGQCEYGSDCVENKPQSNNSPAISLEFDPYYIVGNFGFNVSIDTPREYKLRLVRYPYADYNSHLDIKLNLMRINLAFFLTFGDKDLSKNNGDSFRIGAIMGTVDRTTEYTYKGKSRSFKEPNVGSTGYFLALDLSNHFSFSAYRFDNEAERIELEIWDDEDRPDEFEGGMVAYKEYRYVISYAYYFN